MTGNSGLSKKVRAALGDDLYFIRAGRLVKIGRSRNVPSRFRVLQSGSSEKLTLIATIPGQGWQERVWHYAFMDQRGRGEWFHSNTSLRKAIKKAAAGKEWICEVLSPFDNATEEDHYRWRDRVADLEETLIERDLDAKRQAGWRISSEDPEYPPAVDRGFPVKSTPRPAFGAETGLNCTNGLAGAGDGCTPGNHRCAALALAVLGQDAMAHQAARECEGHNRETNDG